MEPIKCKLVDDINEFNAKSVWFLALPIGGDRAHNVSPTHATIVRVDRVQQVEPRVSVPGAIVKHRGDSGGTVTAVVEWEPLEIVELIEKKMDVLTTRGILSLAVKDGVEEIEKLMQTKMLSVFKSEEFKVQLLNALQKLAHVEKPKTGKSK